MKIKKGLEKDYQEYLYKNVKLKKDPIVPISYVLQIMTTVEVIGNYLDGMYVNGKEWRKPMSPKDAYNTATKDQDLTGFMTGMIANTIYTYHVRGEEFKEWWNAENNVDPKAEGTVNPAVFTFEKKK